MMINAIGCIELSSIAVGYQVADAMKKSASVELVWNQIHCPGRLMLMVLGDTSSVASAIETGRKIGGQRVVDTLVLSRIHQQVLDAIRRKKKAEKIDTLGVIEAYSISSAIEAADLVVNSSNVELLDINVTMGLSGKGIVMIAGDVASVSFAADIARAKAESQEKMLLATVISNPDPDILSKGRGLRV